MDISFLTGIAIDGILYLGIPILIGWLAKKTFWSVLLLHIVSLARFAVNDTEILIPKGKNSTGINKLNLAVDRIISNLEKRGYGIVLKLPGIKYKTQEIASAVVNDTHAAASAYKNIHMELIGEPLKKSES